MEEISLECFFILLISIASFALSFINFFYILKFRKFYEDVNKDYVQALSSIMKVTNDGFRNNFASLEAIQKWNEKAFEKKVEIDNENAKKIIDAIAREQNFLSKIGEQLGYRPRTDLES
jgi:hypothetical protein